jgi:hypothetical protein
MENIKQQWIWEYAVKRIADQGLKAEDCKSSAAAANFLSTSRLAGLMMQIIDNKYNIFIIIINNIF